MSLFKKSILSVREMNTVMTAALQMSTGVPMSFSTQATEVAKLNLPHDGEVRTEPIIAYRAWSYDSGRLAGMGYKLRWPYDGPMKSWHAAVVPTFGVLDGYELCPAGGIYGCESCGIYGFKNVPALRQCFESDVIFGRVALWGKIVEHEDGYRASRAYPQVLYTHNARMEPLVRALADLYGVDVTPLPQEIAREYNALTRVREELAKLKGASKDG
jgi:hypothetical protein